MELNLVVVSCLLFVFVKDWNQQNDKNTLDTLQKAANPTQLVRAANSIPLCLFWSTSDAIRPHVLKTEARVIGIALRGVALLLVYVVKVVGNSHEERETNAY